MSKSQRDKGKRNERLAAKEVTRVLGLQACRTAQNTGMNGLADIDMGSRFHPEVKVRKSIAACRYYEQAIRDMKSGAIPFVLMREDRGDWMLMIKLEDVPAFTDAVDDARSEQQQQQIEHNHSESSACDADHRDSLRCDGAGQT